MCIISTTVVGTALSVMGSVISSALTSAVTSAVASMSVGSTIAAIGTAASLAGGIIGGVSSYQQGNAAQAQYNYQAEVERQNAKIAEQNAAQVRQQGIEESRLTRMKTAQKIGLQSTAMAANGVDVTQGTSVDVIEDTAAMGELDALQTSYNYETKAMQYDQQANNMLNQANIDVISGRNAYSAGRMNALASGLNGISKSTQLAQKWYGYGGKNNGNL